MNLLFPNGKDNIRILNDESCHNLAMDELVKMIVEYDKDNGMVKNILSQIPLDKDTVQYRQDILNDFINDEGFCIELEDLLRELDILKEYNTHNHFLKEKKSNIRDLVDYMEEMKVYLCVIEGMSRLFRNHKVKSKGLNDVAALLKNAVDSNKLSDLKSIVNELCVDVSTLKSMNVGINFSTNLYPEEVVILGFSNTPYKSQFEKSGIREIISGEQRTRYKEPTMFMKYICDDIEKELGKMVKANKKKLREYIDLEGYFLLDICDDIRFYLQLARFARTLLKKGQPICFPEIDENSTNVEICGVYNLRLTARSVENIVKNDFSFSRGEKLYILTGPNRGGKTMLTQGVGIAALLAALGLFVPATSYKGYLFDNILTHFPADENLSLDLGRLGEEATRIKQIVMSASENTLVLLNETYSSTSAYDGLYLAKDLMHVLKQKNVPTIFNTHIHELARCTDEMNEWEGTSDIVSLTMEIADNENTFRVLRSAPSSSSFARNIALKYGVTYEQMMAV